MFFRNLNTQSVHETFVTGYRNEAIEDTINYKENATDKMKAINCQSNL